MKNLSEALSVSPFRSGYLVKSFHHHPEDNHAATLAP
jgi:hypothetical protein